MHLWVWRPISVCLTQAAFPNTLLFRGQILVFFKVWEGREGGVGEGGGGGGAMRVKQQEDRGHGLQIAAHKGCVGEDIFSVVPTMN